MFQADFNLVICLINPIFDKDKKIKYKRISYSNISKNININNIIENVGSAR